MPPALIVQKYGGTSIATVDRIQQVARYIRSTIQPPTQVIVVVSAMGSFTDEWVEAAAHLHPDPPRREMDMLLTAGERMTAALLAMALEKEGLHAISFTGSQIGILTDATHGNAKIHRILGDRIRKSLESNRIVVVAGFQGVDPQTKEVTTLGRGGSDLTAVALAATLRADRCEIYKDVEGIYTADPRVIPKAQHIPRLSWEAACTLSGSGAQVLHDRAANMACKYEIPIHIRSSLAPTQPGTLIEGHSTTMETPHFIALTDKKDQIYLDLLLTFSPGAASIQPLYEWLCNRGDTPLLWNLQKKGLQSELQVTLSAFHSQAYLDFLVAHCQQVLQKSSLPLHILSLVGRGFSQNHPLLDTITSLLGENLLLLEMQQGVMHIGVKSEAATVCIQQLHEGFFV